LIVEETWCHQSQIVEWIPWVGRHSMTAPADKSGWEKVLRERFVRQNRELKIKSQHAFEFFSVTAWGEVADYDQLLRDFPPITPRHSHLKRLKQRLARWKQG